MKAIKILLCISVGLIFSSPCFSGEEIEFRYMGYVFQIPDRPTLITSSGGPSNILNFVYGKGGTQSKFLSIGNLNEDALVQSLESQENCSYSVFLSDAFHQTRNSGCSHEELDDFFNGLLYGNEHGSWPSNDLGIYYVTGKETAYVWIAGNSNVNVTIESNFLDKEKLKEVISNYLQ